MDKYNKDWIEPHIEKEMMLLFDGKRYDVPTSFKRAIAIAIERGIKTTYERIENAEGN